MTTATAAKTASAPAPSGAKHSLKGTGTLIRFTLRRDRIRLLVWISAIVFFAVSFLPSFKELYPDAASRQARAALMDSPAARAMSGPGFGLDDYTFGAMIANEYLAMMALIIALMSVLLTVRYLRAEEETGRAELVRAAVVGRHAPMVSALTVVVGVNLTIALVLTALMPASLDALPADSSFLYSMSLAAVGVVFAGVGAVASQITYSARGASGLGMAVAGAAYVLRAVGDAGDGNLSWATPIGWSQFTKSYVDDRWWPLGISLAVAVALTVLAVSLSVRRDVGAGLRQPRGGAADAPRWLSGPLGLAWRLQRGTLIAWACGLALFGMVYG
ncbi:MAG: ABC transporter permease, partial [Stackebrandtia sp.]